MIPDELLDDLYAAGLAGLTAHLQASGARQIAVPVMGTITGACENVDMSFRTSDGRYLIQTGQLFLEASLLEHRHVFCDVQSSRNENVDHRHLAQFRLIEEEFRWDVGPGDATPAGALASVIERVTFAIRASLGRLIRDFRAPLSELGRLDSLQAACDLPWTITTHAEAVGLAGGRLLEGRIDFSADDEQAIVARAASGGLQLPVFITHYPEQIKFFNMRTARPDSTRVLSVDLLLPFSGESAGGAVREDDYVQLDNRLQASKMLRMHQDNGGTLEDFRPYLELIRRGIPAHAGYGLGFERLVQYILGLSDIRQASPAFRRAALLEW